MVATNSPAAAVTSDSHQFTSRLTKVTAHDFQTGGGTNVLLCGDKGFEVVVRGARLPDLTGQRIELIYLEQDLIGMLVLKTGRWHLLHLPENAPGLLWLVPSSAAVGGVVLLAGLITLWWPTMVIGGGLILAGLIILTLRRFRGERQKHRQVDFIEDFKTYIADANQRIRKLTGHDDSGSVSGSRTTTSA